MEQKVERIEVSQLEPLDLAIDHSREMSGDGFPRDELLENRVPSRLERNDTDIGGVSLVTRARVRDIDETHLHVTISTFVRTTVLSTSAGQYATISSTFGRPPAKPVTLGGPLSTSGAISRVNLSTAALSSEWTATLSSTSVWSSRGGPASGPWVAFQPTNSVRIRSKRS